MDDIIKEIRSEFSRLKNQLQEGNIAKRIVEDVFLKNLGYDTKNVEYEEPSIRGFCDMSVHIKSNISLKIEVKNGYKPLKVEDIPQIMRYVKGKGQRFGILTNGYEYIFLDFDIKFLPKESDEENSKAYIVFWFDVLKGKGEKLTDLKYLKYLSMENLYRSQATHFFCDVAQYGVWKKEQGMQSVSWVAYRCTLYRFFEFYADKVLQKKSYEEVGKKSYEVFSIVDFEEFIETCKRHGANTSTRTINNNYTHIYNMLYEMKKNGKIGHIQLSDSRKKSLSEFKETQERKQFTMIEKQDVEKVLVFLKNRLNGTRDTVIFLFSVTMGMERSQMVNLKWEDIEEGCKYITIDEKKIELCPLLQTYLSRLKKEMKGIKTKLPYVFLVYYNQKYIQISEWAVNNIFNSFEQISNEEKWKDYSPKYLRNCLIKTLFASGYSLEDIMYITGIDIANIHKYLNMSELLQRRSKEIDWKHLYNGLLCAK